MIFICRMPPYISKPYPITKGLSQCSQRKPLPLDDTSTLATLKKLSVKNHPDLRKIVRSVREPLEVFPKTVLRATFDVTVVSYAVKSGDTIEHFHWELTIKEARKNLDCVLDALGVLHQGLFHSKILLKSVQQILDEEQNEFSDEVKKLQKLKGHLLSLNMFLDCVLLQYSNLSCKLSPKLVKDIKRTTKKIHEVIMQLKSNKLETLVPNCMITEEDVLCSVLGLCDEFAERLRYLDIDMRQHKSDMYFLLCFMKERYESLDDEDLSDRVKCLQKIGFTENRSNVIANWIGEQPFPEHRSLLAWAEIYVENLFKYDIFLNDNVCKFPYKEGCIDGWFGVDVSSDECEDSPSVKVDVINTTSEKAAAGIIQEKISKFEVESSPSEKLYFHGTDHNSTKDILENGISLGKGAQKCDFSDGDGFYVTDNYEYALQYSKKHKAQRAVILFNISDDCLKGKLDLSSRERREDLKSVQKYFHSGAPRRNHKLDRALMREVRNCKCIIGPISRDGMKSNKWQDVQQICIRDDKMAENIGNPSNVVGIVFLNAEDNQLARRS